VALTADLKVNSIPIGHIYIRRTSPKISVITDDTVCNYEWIIRINGHNTYSNQQLEHRYGDGALELIRKVIEAFGGESHDIDT
jgi:hypothetical protein